MNRSKSLTIKARSWMNENDYAHLISKHGIEWTSKRGETSCCSQFKGYQVVWCRDYDMDLIKIALLHADPAVILSNFRAFYDNGSQEILINEDNYPDYISVINDWYLQRTGKYEPVE